MNDIAFFLESFMAQSHCTGQGPGSVQGTGVAQQETMGPGPCPCLRAVRTLLHNLLEPIDPGPTPGPGPVQCEYSNLTY